MAIGVPVSVVPLPVPTIPSAWPAVDPLSAAIVSAPPPETESVTTMAVPAAFRAAVNLALAAWISAKTSSRVATNERST
jgi:hypothetical protein